MEATLGKLNQKVSGTGNMEVSQPKEATNVEDGKKQSAQSMSNNTSDVFVISEMCHKNSNQETS